MSDINAEKGLTSAILQNGDMVHINDHVYLAPEHLGETYYIGRIMEFCTSNKRKGLQVRIAWFNRPKDVINRKTADPCLLVATMHSDVNPVSSIRGKCTVTHKYYLKKTLEAYRKKPDHFYYNQLYDRYIQRVYDVVPCETIQNLPEDILQALSRKFQYVIVEQGHATNLTLARRICCVCQDWCPNNCYVTCAACQKNYHLFCVNPPLSKRPSKGFAWQCAFCTRKVILGEEEAALATTATTANNNSNSKALAITATAVTTDAETEAEPIISPFLLPLFNATGLLPLPAASSSAASSISSSSSTSLSSNIISSDVSKETIIKSDRQRTTRSQTPKPKMTEPRKETSIKLKLIPKPATSSPLSSQSTTKQEKGEVMTDMWPFRYFGVNSDIKRIFDKNDQIYPRAQSRIGPKYQATLEETSTVRSVTPVSENSGAGGSSTPKPKHYNFNNVNNNKRPDRKGKSVQRSKADSPGDSSQDYAESMIPTRGTDDTITPIFSQPNYLDESELDVYMEKVKNLPNLPLSSYSSDLMDRALIELELNSYNTDVALDHMSRLNKDDFKYAVDWSREEIDAFEQSMREHGHELNCAKRAVKTKSMADVVRFFYQWKKTDRYEPVYSEWTKVFKPTKNFKKGAQRKGSIDEGDVSDELHDSGGEEEADPTVIPINSKKHYQCMNCQTDQSIRWRRSPSDTDRKRKQFKQVLCDECGIYWMKYGIMKPGGGPKPKRHLEQPETPAIKRKKSNEPASKPIVPKKQKEDFLPSECKVCLDTGPEHLLYTCHGCGMSVHSDCYGIKKGVEIQGWKCDPCENKINPVASYTYDCVLCCQPCTDPQQPLKRTSGYSWAHLQCAMFIPEIKFVDTSILSPVEYIGCINYGRIEQVCQLCHNHKGTCVACAKCSKPVHVKCAMDNQFKLAFEIQTSIPENNVNDGLFGPNSPAGFMIPQVWCPEHVPSDQTLIDLSARTTNTQESSLMTYAKNYKRVSPNTTPAMRRFRGTRHHPYNNITKSHKVPSARDAALEAIKMKETFEKSTIITTNVNTTSSLKKSQTQMCSTKGCKVKYSPIWWDVSTNSEKKICQGCHLQVVN